MRFRLTLLALCCAASVLSCTAADAPAPTAGGGRIIPPAAATVVTQTPQQHALLVAIPLPGHVNPLLSQGLELSRRGWRVTVASPNRMKKHILSSLSRDGHAEESVAFMDLGDCSAVAELHDALERAAGYQNYMDSAREMFDWAIHLHHCMYVSLHDQIPKLSQKPTIIVSDLSSYAGFDVADAFDIPWVVNNPDLLNMLSPEDVQPYDYVPGTMTAKSISTVNGTDSFYGLAERVIYPPLRLLLRWICEVTAGKELGVQQELSGLVPTGMFSRLSGHLILVNNVFGIEYARAVPPNVVMVGPMLEKKWQASVHDARREYMEQLSEEDETWLSHKEPGATTAPPVIWVSMGTIAPLNQRQVLEMYSAFEEGARAGRFRVLWKLDPSDHGFLPASMPPTTQLRVTTWVSSQLGVLSHPATQVFLSHCGINSVHESVYLGTALLCIPILADQADMAARVEDAGCGTHLEKATFTATTLTAKLREILTADGQAYHAHHLARARSAMRLAGGVERAVDYIEYAAAHGSSALVPVDVSHPWYVRYNFDVLFLYVVILLFISKFWLWVCCKARPGKECVADRQKVRDATRNGRTKHE